MISLFTKYKREDYISFLSDFLPNGVKFFNKSLDLSNDFNFFLEATLLSEVKSLNDLKIIEIEHNTSINKKITISREIFKLMSNYAYSNALVILKSKNSSNYRLSFILSSLEWKNDKSVKKVFSEPKRLSYLLGEGIKQYTPKQQLINKGKIKDFEDLKSRFDIEIVTNEFFDKYNILYQKLFKFFSADNDFKDFTKKKSLDLDVLTKKLLGQIVFCYFLQKKKWLGANKSSKLDSGDINFLRSTFIKCEKEKKNFYNDYLEFIFYEGLNKENSNDYVAEIDCKIPFLNGGLFEPLEDYEWKKEFLTIPNDIFSNKQNNGILDIFDLYNFTVDEHSDYEKEIAIDPEMLGKVFEKLLPENIRKNTGSYYTPRPIVDYLCKKGLIEYLYNNFKSKINFDKLADFIFNLNKINSNEDLDSKIEIEIKNDAKELIKVIDNLKICDPAVGSGAFLVSMLDIVTKVKYYLLLFLENKEPDTYQIKKKFIENSLYGVDIDPGAIEIAKLRLWLSLVVDETNYLNIGGLPNLDFKLVQGNSLHNNIENVSLELDVTINRQLELGEEVDEKSEKLIKNLKNTEKKYFNSNNPIEKKSIKDQLMQTIYDLVLITINKKKDFNPNLNFDLKNLKNQIYGLKVKNFFPWQIYFIDVFHNNKGFDLIIGNPPWKSLLGKHNKTNESKDILKKLSDEYLVNSYMPNLYEFFLQLSNKIVTQKGVIAQIIPDRFGYNYSSKIIREHFLKNNQIIEIIYNWDFPEVVADTMTLLMKKNVKQDHKISIKNNKFSSKIIYKKSEIEKDLNLTFRKYISLKHKNLVDKIISQSVDFEKYAKITSGFGGKSQLMTTERINNNQIEVIKGKSINRYKIDKKYFFELKNENITGRTRDINKLTIKDKIFIRVTGSPIIATYDNKGTVPEASLHFIYNLDPQLKHLYILGLLNSKLFTWFACNRPLYTNLESMAHFKILDLYQLPIKIASNKDQNIIEDLSKQLLENQDENTKVSLMKDIDDKVYKIFEVSKEEIKFIESEYDEKFN
jgi:hypothetical protein